MLRPEAPEGGEPGVELHERFRSQSIEASLRYDAGFDESGVAQHAQMLGDGGLRQPQLALDLAHGALGREQQAEDGPSTGLGDDGERGFHDGNMPCRLYSCQGMPIRTEADHAHCCAVSGTGVQAVRYRRASGGTARDSSPGAPGRYSMAGGAEHSTGGIMTEMGGVPVGDLFELSSELRCQTAFDHLAVGSAITAPDGRWLRVNCALAALLGYAEAELVGRTFQSLTHPDDVAECMVQLRLALAGGLDRYRMEQRLLHAHGRAIWAQVTASAVRDTRGLVRCFVAQYEDLTERKAAEAQLGESEQRYRTLVETAHEGICTVDAIGQITYVNQRLAGMLGSASDELVGQPLFNFMEPDSAFTARTRFARQQLGIAESVELAFLRKEGTTLWTLQSASSLFGADGQFTGAVYLLTDVTERHVAEKRLAESERYFRALAEQSSELVCVLDGDCIIRYANAGFSRTLGYELDEAIGHAAFEFIHEDDLPRIRELFVALLRRPRGCVEARYHVRTRQGTLCLLTGVAQNLLDDPAVNGIVINAQDVTERRRADDALRESEARFQHIVNNVPGMVYQWMYRPDGSGRYTYVSEGARTLFGVAPDDALRDPEALLGLLPPEDREQLRAQARDAAARLVQFRWEGRAVLASGEQRVIQIAAHGQRLADGTVLSDGVVIDVTAQRELEQQLRQAQKMEAVGQLAGGIAHDFNNLLTVISSYTTMALESLPSGTQVAADLDEVRKAADRATGLTRQLLAFGRKQMLQLQRLDTNRAVTEVAGMLRRLIAEDITLQMELGHDLWPILADPGQLSQVLLNLSVNARDAMPSGGTLRVVTANASVAPGRAPERPWLVAGDYVTIVVEDTGIGIDPAVMPHIFEPFFTTKGAGGGTGLGLATVYGIVKQSGGFIYADSVVGKGTRFTVLLPRADDSPVEPCDQPEPVLQGGSETILLVEDEHGVRGAVCRMLGSLGYRVLEAESAADALRVVADADAQGTPVHLVLTDVVMPNQGGRALGERLAAFRPEIPLVYMSGYTDDEILRRGLHQAPFLKKPFTREQLARAVSQALQSGRGGAVGRSDSPTVRRSDSRTVGQ